MYPRTSLIVPSCNEGEWLERTAASARRYEPAITEILHVDDGSNLNDGSGHSGIKVSLSYGPVPSVGANAVLTGCCGATDIPPGMIPGGMGGCARYLRPRSGSDVSYDQAPNYLRNGGFETGLYAPWSYGGGGVRSGTWTLGLTAHTGSKFFGIYSSNYAVSGTLGQTVSVPSGEYQASTWSQVYRTYSDPTAAADRVGIDPTGGTNPNSPNVVWSAWDTQSTTSFSAWRLISTPSVSVASGACTVFLQYSQPFNSGRQANCFDDVGLVPTP